MNACLPYFPFGIKVIQKYSVHNITRYSRVTLNFVCLPIHQEFFVWIYSAYLWIVSCLINFKSKEFCLMFHHMQNKPIVKLLNEIKIFSIRKFWENFHRNFFYKMCYERLWLWCIKHKAMKLCNAWRWNATTRRKAYSKKKWMQWVREKKRKKSLMMSENSLWNFIYFFSFWRCCRRHLSLRIAIQSKHICNIRQRKKVRESEK